MSSQATRTFILYTQPDDPACDQARSILSEHGFPYLEVDFLKLTPEMQNEFGQHYKMTLPVIMINGELVGGVEDLKLFLASVMGQAMLADVVMPPIQIQCLSRTAKTPSRGTPEAIGLDLYADLGIGQKISIPPNEIRKVPTGWAMRAPAGHYLRVAPKSGLATKGLDVLAGVIDRDYTGEVAVIVATHGHENIEIKHGEKVAQVIVERATICDVVEVKALSATARGDGGFGSTGK